MYYTSYVLKKMIFLFLLSIGVDYICSTSGVPMDEPDLSLHPRAEHLKKYSQRVILNSGDALFIPEGW